MQSCGAWDFGEGFPHPVAAELLRLFAADLAAFVAFPLKSISNFKCLYPPHISAGRALLIRCSVHAFRRRLSLAKGPLYNMGVLSFCSGKCRYCTQCKLHGVQRAHPYCFVVKYQIPLSGSAVLRLPQPLILSISKGHGARFGKQSSSTSRPR